MMYLGIDQHARQITISLRDDGGADGLDGPAGEAQGNSSMTSCEFVVHGYLRVAAAGGCPRG